MRSLAPLLLLLAGLVPLRAQWQIFAEKLPAPGTWASFRMGVSLYGSRQLEGQ